jgi:hypothetical protein
MEFSYRARSIFFTNNKDVILKKPLDQSNVALVPTRPQQQTHQTTALNDFLSMDFLSQELPPLSHGVIASQNNVQITVSVKGRQLSIQWRTE